jgi:hypothetical protein
MSKQFVDFSSGGFFRYYWWAFAWILVSWVLFAVAALSALVPVYYIFGFCALVRAIWVGWRPPSVGEMTDSSGGCIGTIIGFVLVVLIWPLAELWRQVRFLWLARQHWQKREILVDEKSGNPVYSA